MTARNGREGGGGRRRVVQGETQGQVDRVDVMKMEVGMSKIETVGNESMISLCNTWYIRGVLWLDG